jgi:hypothetical protein
MLKFTFGFVSGVLVTAIVGVVGCILMDEESFNEVAKLYGK